MDNKQYNVVLFDNASAATEVIARLAQLFKIPEDKARLMLQQDSFAIKKQADQHTAEKFRKAISAAGVNCRIEEAQTADTPLPTIEEVAPQRESAPLIDPTQQIHETRSGQRELSLQGAPVEKAQSATTQDKAFEQVDASHYCPQCGTVRASSDSACTQCGYDPQVIKRQARNKRLVKSLIAVLGLAIIAAIAVPLYLHFSRLMQIQADLKLAFETRNKVTEFIKKTNFWPNQNIDAGLPKQIRNQSIKSLQLGKNAVITVTLDGRILEGEDQTLIFTPNTLKGKIVWNCTRGTLQASYRPEICQDKVIKP